MVCDWRGTMASTTCLGCENHWLPGFYKMVVLPAGGETYLFRRWDPWCFWERSRGRPFGSTSSWWASIPCLGENAKVCTVCFSFWFLELELNDLRKSHVLFVSKLFCWLSFFCFQTRFGQGYSWSTNWKKDGHHSELSAMLGAVLGISKLNVVNVFRFDCHIPKGVARIDIIKFQHPHVIPCTNGWPIDSAWGAVKTVGFGVFDLLAFFALKASRQAYSSPQLQVGLGFDVGPNGG